MKTKLHYDVRLYDRSSIPLCMAEKNNALIEGIEDFLTLQTPFYHNDDFAPFSIAMDLSLKIDLSEDLAGRPLDCRYARIEGFSDATTSIGVFYYFVSNARRLADKTMILDLRMDTLTTNQTYIKSALTDRTMVNREHRDRFVKEYYGGTYPRTLSLRRIIDRVSEGIQPIKRASSESRILESDGSARSYYLLYKTAKDLSASDLDNPVSCYLVSDERMLVSTGSAGPVVTWAASDLSTDVYYYIIRGQQDNPGAAITCSGAGTYSLGDDLSGDKIFGFAIHKSGSDVLTQFIVYNSAQPNVYKMSAVYQQTASVRLDAVKGYRSMGFLTDQTELITGRPFVAISSGVVADAYSLPFSEVQRTDSKYLKIIKLPYSPTAKSVASDGVVSFYGFKYDPTSQMFLFNSSVTLEFGNERFASVSLDAYLTQNLGTVYGMSNLVWIMRGTLTVDSKIYHSDFFAVKLNYDSFSITIPLEMTSGYSQSGNSFSLSFKPTNTINSNFAFFIAPTFEWSKELDYADYLLSSRNNEMTIFSNDYINYIKTGFNYDKKSKAIQSAFTWSGAALSIGGGIAAAVLGKDPVTKATGVGLAVGGFAEISAALNTTISNERDLNQKIAELKEQATTTIGVDDIDILSYYSGNKLRFSVWECAPEVKSLISAMFYFYGYQTGWQKIPEWSSRWWFNYIQCIPYFDGSKIPLRSDIIGDVSERFQNGVTVFHERKINNLNQWDFAQRYENWETWAVE